MNIVLSYVGPLPAYTVDCIQQIRLFSKCQIYIILDDVNSPCVKELETYNVTFIDYNTVKSQEFLNLFESHKKPFSVCDDLGDRRFIFMRSIERFFLLFNLMQQKALTDVLFMEIDNTIYDDPMNWFEQFSKKELCFMYDNEERFSCGLFYTKTATSLIPLLSGVFQNIHKYRDWYCDMAILYELYETEYSKSILLLPTHTGVVVDDKKFFRKGDQPTDSLNTLTCMNYGLFGETIFDAAGMGVYLFGCDPFHSGGVVVHNFSEKTWSHIKFSQYEYKWEKDSLERKIPYVNFGDGTWIRVNNLHIHSKDLKSALSV